MLVVYVQQSFTRDKGYQVLALWAVLKLVSWQPTLAVMFIDCEAMDTGF